MAMLDGAGSTGALASPAPSSVAPLGPLPGDARTHEDLAALAARLHRHVCAESVIDRDAHALGVARMVLSTKGVK